MLIKVICNQYNFSSPLCLDDNDEDDDKEVDEGTDQNGGIIVTDNSHITVGL